MATSVVHVRRSAFDVYIGRKFSEFEESIWHNPFKIADNSDRASAIAQYRDYVLGNPALVRKLPTLHNKSLGCWCKPEACHGDVLKDLVDAWTQFKSYAGVGSRETPDDILYKFEKLAARLGSAGYSLRSGGADGADSAFEKGAEGFTRHIFIPWDGFNGRTYLATPPTEDALSLAKSVHPAWGSLKDAPRKLHGRNAYQVFGKSLAAPARFVVCWTEDGAETKAETTRNTGGTRTAIVLAESHGIPVFNFARADAESRLEALLSGEEPVSKGQLALF